MNGDRRDPQGPHCIGDDPHNVGWMRLNGTLGSTYRPPYDPLLNPEGDKPALVVGRVEQLTQDIRRVADSCAARPKPLPSFWVKPDADALEVLGVLNVVLRHEGDLFVCDRGSLERVRDCVSRMLDAKGDS